MVVHLVFSDQVAEMNERPAATPHCRSDRLGSVRKRFPRHPRATKELAPLVLIHPVAYMQDELCCGACDTFAMGHVIKRLLQLGMPGNILANLLHCLAGRTQALLELEFGLHLGLPQRHLRPTMRVTLASARGHDGEKDHVLELVDDCRLNSVGLG